MPMIEVTEHEKMILYGLRSMIAENNDEQLKAVEDTYFAKSKQTLFTKAELADKWGCSESHVGRVLDLANVESVSKRGKSFEYDIEQADEAKRSHDGQAIIKHKINMRAKAI